MKNVLVVVIALAAGLAASGCVKEDLRMTEDLSMEILVVDDFDAGNPPNMLGGAIGAWDKDPEDPTQTSEISYDSGIRLGDDGYSLRIKYDVDSPNPAFNGVWMQLEGADFSEYSELCLSVKGDADAGFTPRFKIELKNSVGNTGMYMLSGITREWQEKVIPLNEFRGIRNLSSMSELVIVFEDEIANPREGVIYIDNIYLQ